MSPGMIHFPLASIVCAFLGTLTSLRAPTSTIRPLSITIALLRIVALPVPLIKVAPWMTMGPDCCWAKANAVNSRQRRRTLIFDVFMFSFLEKDLNSFLSDKRKHHQCPERIPPPEIHRVRHQHRDQQHHREI